MVEKVALFSIKIGGVKFAFEVEVVEGLRRIGGHVAENFGDLAQVQWRRTACVDGHEGEHGIDVQILRM